MNRNGERRAWRLAAAVLGAVALAAVVSLWLPQVAAPQGTDGGRVWLAAAHGARSFILVAVPVMALALGLGIPLGLLAGGGPRLAAFTLSRSVELSGMLPSLLIWVLVESALGQSSRWAFVLTLGTLRAILVARMVRGEVLRVAGEPFVLAAQSLGGSPARVLWRHLLPHALGPALVTAAFTPSWVIALEAGLALAGLGLPTSTPSWGQLLKEAGPSLPALIPAALIVVTTVAGLLVAERIEQRLLPGRTGTRTGEGGWRERLPESLRQVLER